MNTALGLIFFTEVLIFLFKAFFRGVWESVVILACDFTDKIATVFLLRFSCDGKILSAWLPFLRVIQPAKLTNEKMITTNKMILLFMFVSSRKGHYESLPYSILSLLFNKLSAF